jgi:hypothetical protein
VRTLPIYFKNSDEQEDENVKLEGNYNQGNLD